MAIPPEDGLSSNSLLVVTTLALIWTSLFTAVRIWVKSVGRTWFWFDAVFMTSYVVAAAQCTAVYLAIAQYGFGEGKENAYLASSHTGWRKAFFVSEIFYVLCVGLSKCSTALFLGGLSRERKQKRFGFALAAVAGAWAVASTLAVALRSPLLEPWMTVMAPYTRWLGVEICGLLIEALLWLFSVTLILGLHMPVRRRVKLLLIFGTRLFLIPVVAVRIYRLSPTTYDSRSVYDIILVQIFTQVAMHYSLIAECFTSLKPFMQTFHEGFAESDGSSHYWGDVSYVSQKMSNNNSTVDKATDAKQRPRISQRQISATSWRSKNRQSTRDDMKSWSERAGFSTKIESERKSAKWDRGGGDDIDLLSLSREENGIRVQQTMTMSMSR